MTQRRHLIGWHDAIGCTEQDHGDAVVVRRPEVLRSIGGFTGRVRFESAAQILQCARQIAVAAEREHVGDVIADRRPARGDERQPAGEADAHQADPAVGREVWLRQQPFRGVFDLVHGLRSEAVVREIGRRDRDDRQSGGGELSSQPFEARLLDPHRVHAGSEDDGASRAFLTDGRSARESSRAAW